MKKSQQIVDQEVPAKGFFDVGEASDVSGFSRDHIAKEIRAGRLKALQATPGTQGSRLRIPRGELVRWLSEMVR